MFPVSVKENSGVWDMKIAYKEWVLSMGQTVDNTRSVTAAGALIDW